MISDDLQSIPILAYTFISLTSVILAYVTLMDTENNSSSDKTESVSATNMLPNLNPFTTVANEPATVVNQSTNAAAETSSQKPTTEIFGGKKHKHTKRNNKNKLSTHKKTRMNHKHK